MNSNFRTIGRFNRSPLSSLAVALSLVACSGSAGKLVTPPDASVEDASEAGGGCAHDEQCAALLPATSPANCAVAKCVASQCVFSAKDEDGDGHPTNRCKSLSDATPITAGDDCNDHDPHLYPGHPEPCSTAADGTTVCTMGSISCLPDGEPSACEGTVACTASEACANGGCETQCTTGATACGYAQQPVVCMAGAWENAGLPCVDQACVNGACAGTCAPQSLGCVDAMTPGVCDANGTLQPQTPCVNQVCSDGVCGGACTPGATNGCFNNAPATCDPSGEFQPNGPACGGDAPNCVLGVCSVCIPGYPGACLNGTTTSVCGANGAWQPDTMCPSICSDGVCTGQCVPGAVGCYGPDSAETCGADGDWQYTSCNSQGTCVDGECVGTCLAGQTQCTGSYLFSRQPETCNGQGQWAADGAACSNQYCVPGTGCVSAGLLVSANATALAADANNLYWRDSLANDVVKMSIAGPDAGTVTTLAKNQPVGYGIAIDATYVYWTAYNIVKMPLNGGPVTTVASATGNPDPDSNLVLQDGYLYWAQAVGSTADDDIMKVAVTGGAVTTLATGLKDVLGIAASSQYVSWEEGDTNAMMAVPIGGGGAFPFAYGPLQYQSIAADVANIYWVSSGSVMTVPAGATNVTTLFSATGSGITISGTTLYWDEGGGIASAPASGGPVTQLTTQGGGDPIVVVGTNLYWLDGDGNIFGALNE